MNRPGHRAIRKQLNYCLMKTLDLIKRAAFLKIDRTTALALAGRGELPGAKVGRAWVSREVEAAEWLRQQIASQRRQRQAEASHFALDAQTSSNARARIAPPTRPPANSS